MHSALLLTSSEDNPDCFDLVEWVLFDTHTESVYESEVEQEEKIEKIINNFRELIKGLENDEAIALLEIEIPKLQEGETKEIYKKGLSKLYIRNRNS